MKILLINPRTSFNFSFAGVPLGVLAIGSYLKAKGYDVRVLDRSVQRNKITKVFAEFKPDAVGISLVSSSAIADTVKLSEYCKVQGIPVIMGGAMATAIPEQLLKEGAADYVVLGEGEITIHELLQKLEIGEAAGELPGLVYLNGDAQVHYTPNRPFADLSTFPKTDWSLIKPSRYWNVGVNTNKAIYTYRSKGCPGSCTFCFNKSFHQSTRRVRSDDAVLEEIRELVSIHGADGIFFGDECFCTKREEMLTFCDKLKALNLNFFWTCITRVNITRQELQAMYDAGCRGVFFGVESGSREMLKRIQKNISLELIEDTFRHCREIGIHTTASFIIDLPDETEEDLMQTLDLIRKIGSVISLMQFFSPEPQTVLWNKLVAQGKLKPPQDLAGWSKLFIRENGGGSFSKIPQRELHVVQKFAVLLSILHREKGRTSPLYILRRGLVEFTRSISHQGLADVIANLFLLGMQAVKAIWYLTAYPKIRKKYGLYLRNFRQN